MPAMKIAIAADHGGYPLKEQIVKQLKSLGHEVSDLGAHTLDPLDDYPDFAHAVAVAVQQKKADKGIILCGSGVGACVAANKHKGVRASVCHDTYSAAQGVEHDDMNVLCLGSRIVGSALATELVKAFAGAKFTAEERHARRLEKVLAFEKDNA
ncbi:MAG: ribose 5-phosphate isomerase B [Phycisphaera sp.]|nr:ribose 5-phosphate isomerase B [Phycisphaera sp.]